MTSRLLPPAYATGAQLADSVPAYHNSGPMRNSAYRTGAVGVGVEISGTYITSKLLEAAQLQPLAARLSNDAFGQPLHPVLVHGAACSALVQLGASPAVTHDAQVVIDTLATQIATTITAPRTRATRLMADTAIAAIVTLRDVLRERELLPPFHGIVSDRSYDYVQVHTPMPWLCLKTHDHTVALAWGMVAMACASPPILLFHRQPSLMWFRRKRSLSLRWFGSTIPATATTPAPREGSR